MKFLTESVPFRSLISSLRLCSSSKSVQTWSTFVRMSSRVPMVKLNNGCEMPAIGLGTSMSKGEECVAAVKAGIDVGFRHIDTAYFYRNENAVGQAIRVKIEEGVVARDELFVSTKLWNSYHHPDHVALALEKSLENLGVESVDMYLIHMPFGYKFIGWDSENLMPFDEEGKLQFSDVDYVDTWRAMEQLVKSGKTQCIGVSNFNSEQIDRILAECEIKPAVNQIECNPRINQKKLIEFCNNRGILVTAHSPLGRPHLYQKDPENKPKPVLHEQRVLDIGKKYDKTAVQVVLRYLYEIGAVPIPKSASSEHLKQNLEIFDFKLSKEDIKVMDEFNIDQRMVHFKRLQHHKYYPFRIEF